MCDRGVKSEGEEEKRRKARGNIGQVNLDETITVTGDTVTGETTDTTEKKRGRGRPGKILKVSECEEVKIGKERRSEMALVRTPAKKLQAKLTWTIPLEKKGDTNEKEIDECNRTFTIDEPDDGGDVREYTQCDSQCDSRRKKSSRYSCIKECESKAKKVKMIGEEKNNDNDKKVEVGSDEGELDSGRSVEIVKQKKVEEKEEDKEIKTKNREDEGVLEEHAGSKGEGEGDEKGKYIEESNREVMTEYDGNNKEVKGKGELWTVSSEMVKGRIKIISEKGMERGNMEKNQEKEEEKGGKKKKQKVKEGHKESMSGKVECCRKKVGERESEEELKEEIRREWRMEWEEWSRKVEGSCGEIVMRATERNNENIKMLGSVMRSEIEDIRSECEKLMREKRECSECVGKEDKIEKLKSEIVELKQCLVFEKERYKYKAEGLRQLWEEERERARVRSREGEEGVAEHTNNELNKSRRSDESGVKGWCSMEGNSRRDVCGEGGGARRKIVESNVGEVGKGKDRSRSKSRVREEHGEKRGVGSFGRWNDVMIVKEKEKEGRCGVSTKGEKGPKKLNDEEYIKEIREREWRKRNVCIRVKGEGRDMGEAIHTIEKKMDIRFGNVAEITWEMGENARRIRVREMKNKIEIMRRKGMIRGSDVWIDDDLTAREIEVQKWLRKLAEEENEKGKVSRAAYMKIERDGEWWGWNEREGKLEKLFRRRGSY